MLKRFEWGEEVPQNVTRAIVTLNGEEWRALVTIEELERIEKYDNRKTTASYGTAWTAEEDAFLEEFGSDVKVAGMTGRTPDAVKRRRERLAR